METIHIFIMVSFVQSQGNLEFAVSHTSENFHLCDFASGRCGKYLISYDRAFPFQYFWIDVDPMTFGIANGVAEVDQALPVQVWALGGQPGTPAVYIYI